MASIILNLLFFACISAASFLHFDVKKNTTGNGIVRAASLLSTIALIYLSYNQRPISITTELLSGILTMIAFAIFFLAISETRGKSFGVAFDTNQPKELICSGIYAKIRNPFYVSYLLYWASWVFLSELAIASIIIIAFFVAIYTKSALLEERILTETFGDQYDQYREKVGLFLPKF